MEVSLSAMADTLSLANHLSITGSLQIVSVIFPIDAVAPPPVRSRSTCRTSARRTLHKRRRRTRHRSPPSDCDDGAGFLCGDDGSYFGGGGGWNYGGYSGGGSNWDDWSSSSYPDDPAFDFVYEVLCWIVFSNCLHFAFKKVLRLFTEEREKVPLRIASVC